jgi:hypothetical protein
MCDVDEIVEGLRDEVEVKGVMITLHSPGGLQREASVYYDGRWFVYRGWTRQEAIERTLDRVRAHIQTKRDKEAERSKRRKQTDKEVEHYRQTLKNRQAERC